MEKPTSRPAGLGAIAAALALTAAAFFWSVPMIVPTQTGSSLRDAEGVVDLYHLSGTTVGLLNGDIFDLKPPLAEAAIAVSAKFNLEKPFTASAAQMRDGVVL